MVNSVVWLETIYFYFSLYYIVWIMIMFTIYHLLRDSEHSTIIVKSFLEKKIC